jgi:hypothetical protein
MRLLSQSVGLYCDTNELENRREEAQVQNTRAFRCSPSDYLAGTLHPAWLSYF